MEDPGHSETGAGGVREEVEAAGRGVGEEGGGVKLGAGGGRDSLAGEFKGRKVAGRLIGVEGGGASGADVARVGVDVEK